MRTIFVSIALCLISVLSYSQTKHYSLTECNNDPLKYIEKNYEDNGTRYVGKTIRMFIDECGLNLHEFYPVECSPWADDQTLFGKIEALKFRIRYQNYEYDIRIYLDSPEKYSEKEVSDLEDEDECIWNDALYNYFKDATIKRFFIHKQKDGTTIKNYRRP